MKTTVTGKHHYVKISYDQFNGLPKYITSVIRE